MFQSSQSVGWKTPMTAGLSGLLPCQLFVVPANGCSENNAKNIVAFEYEYPRNAPIPHYGVAVTNYENEMLQDVVAYFGYPNFGLNSPGVRGSGGIKDFWSRLVPLKP